MKTEVWLRANELFEQAIELPEPERSTWLDQACGNDPTLRAQVARRLRTDADAENLGFLGQPHIASPSTVHQALLADSGDDEDQAATPLPRRLGPYRILREIGRGGMGTVYAAERDDDAFQRQVAIKVIAAGSESEEVARRLRAERRILALLEHPNIAQIYDGGASEDGRPYFVMELVSGSSIDAYCATHQLSVPQRIALVRQVCLAVDYAHRNLVVHRDLKPSNIMITDEGEAKLLDFGIAKVLENDALSPTETTEPWRQHLTLNYASPEQLRGQSVSTASDVYALGVLLFRLLAGVMPRSFHGKSPWQAEREIATTELPKPSVAVRDCTEPRMLPPGGSRQLERQLLGDLDAIVLKALRSDPESRYRSAGHLADDLERHHTGLPVGARKATWRYRGAKLLRRNPLAATLGAVAIGLGVAFIAMTLITSRQLAEKQAIQDVTLRFLLGIFEDAGPYVAEGRQFTLLEAVDRQAERLDKSELDAQPTVKAELESTLGQAFLEMGQYKRAIRHLEEALDLFRITDDKAGVAESLSGMATAEGWLSNFDRAAVLSAEAMMLHRQLSFDPLRSLRIFNNRVNLFCYQSNFKEAEPLSVEALNLARAAYSRDSPEVSRALIHRAHILNNLGSPQEARTLYLEAESLLSQRYGPEHPAFAELYNNLGQIEASARRSASAVDFWKRSDAQYASAFGDHYFNRVIPLRQLGRHLYKSGNLEDAEPPLRMALQVATESKALGPRHQPRYYGLPAITLVKTLQETGRCKEAVELLGSRVDEWSQMESAFVQQVVASARAALAPCVSQPSDRVTR